MNLSKINPNSISSIIFWDHKYETDAQIGLESDKY
jgi:hypothetical protein